MDKQSRTVLHHVVAAQDAHWVRTLLQARAAGEGEVTGEIRCHAPDATDSYGGTPLLQAAGFGDSALLGVLLKLHDQHGTIAVAPSRRDSGVVVAWERSEVSSRVVPWRSGQHEGLHVVACGGMWQGHSFASSVRSFHPNISCDISCSVLFVRPAFSA